MNKKILFATLFLLVVVFVLTACSASKTMPSISDTNWKLVSYGPISSQILATVGVETSLKFGADGQVNGNLGCNSFGGDYTQKNGLITFGALASTEMACPGPQMSQEGISFAILTGSVNFTLVGDTLTIIDVSGKNELVLTRK